LTECFNATGQVYEKQARLVHPVWPMDVQNSVKQYVEEHTYFYLEELQSKKKIKIEAVRLET